MPPYQYAFPNRNMMSQADSAHIESANIPRSTFLNQWSRKTTFDAGYLVPFLLDEILPGDHMEYNVTAYIRMATPLFPLFDQQRIDTHFFFVPCRLVWDNFTRQHGDQPTGSQQSIALITPSVTMTMGGEAVGSIYDHMGIPVAGQVDPAATPQVISLPLRAYNLIYNEWFRDQNQPNNATAVPLGDGPDTSNQFTLLLRAKSHDYFTSALPWPQKFTAPTVPIGGLAPVVGIGKGNQNFPLASQAVFETGGADTYAFAAAVGDPDGANDGKWYFEGSAAATGLPRIYADLSVTTGISINTLRQAWMVQSLLERDARGGTRYVELLRSHFGAINPDFRLQRPEYIGGGQTDLNITPIAQTAPTTGVPLGAIGGAGTAAGQHRASYAATEHGYIIGLISVKSELSYQQGLHRMWTRGTRYDYYYPALAQLGEQAIMRSEIYANAPIDFTTVWGYTERWDEYRTKYSDVTGLFRSTSTGAIDQWHLSQEFATPPALNMTFLNDSPPMTRVLAAGSAANLQQYLADILMKRRATRPLPTYGTPAILGRF